LTGCRETILHDLSEVEANRVLSRLDQVDIESRKEVQADGRWAVSVAATDTVKALTFIDGARLLVRRPEREPSAGSSGFLPSREEGWLRYQRSIATSIEETLGAMPGTLEARVHLNVRQSDPIFGKRERVSGSGSVLLVVTPAFTSTNDEVAALVAGAAGLDASEIRVLRSTPSESPLQAPPAPKSVAISSDLETSERNNLFGPLEIALSGAIFVGGFVLVVRKWGRRGVGHPFTLKRET